MDYADMALVRALKEDPVWATLLCDAYIRIVDGGYDREYVSVIMDPWGRASPTFGDVFCFIQVHSMIASGRALMTQVHVGGEPFGDKRADENNQLLASLPTPFSGMFVGGGGDNDGDIDWSGSIEASVQRDGLNKIATLPPGKASLEVGHTTAMTTLLHLKESHNLARWPYGSTDITIIHVVEPEGWSIVDL